MRPTEYSLVRQHPIIGERILETLLRSRLTVLAVVRWDHERYDGTGFPDGLRGEFISLESRIAALADAFDAMTTRRPYRQALLCPLAIKELRQQAGRQFDPALVRTFVEVHRYPRAGARGPKAPLSVGMSRR